MLPCDLSARGQSAARTSTTASCHPEGWHSYWCAAQKPGYSGVATICRQKPDEVIDGLGVEAFDAEGRVQAVRFDNLLVVGAYFPNSQAEGKRLDYKLAFCAEMERFLTEWRSRGCETVLVGDYNIAHQPIDLARPQQNEKNPGYLPEERAWMSHFLGEGYRDVFRDQHPEVAHAYSWWSYRGGARAKNVGWRIDYCTVSADLAASDPIIHTEQLGSDHCPVSVVVSPK